MVYGYASLKTKGTRSYEAQRSRIKKHDNSAIVIEDRITIKESDTLNPGMQRLMNKIKPEDTVVFCDVTRISDTAEKALKIYGELLKRGANVIILDAPFISSEALKSEALSRFGETDIKNILDVISCSSLLRLYMEHMYDKDQKRKDNREAGRLEAELNMRKTQGKRGVVLFTSRYMETKDIIERESRFFNGSKPDDVLIKELHLARNTYFKYKKMIKEERRTRQQLHSE